MACSAFLVFFALTASAETEAVRIAYDAPEGCGSEAEVRRAFRSLLEDTQGEEPLLTTIEVKPIDGKLILEFHATYRGAESERTLEVEDCASAMEAAAVLMLLTVDPVLARDLGKTLEPAPPVEEPKPEPAPEPALAKQPPPKATPPEKPRAAEPPAPPSPPRSKWVTIGPALRTGASPNVALGGSVEGGVSFAPLDVVLGLGAYRGFAARVPGVPSSEVTSTLLDLRTRAQWRLHVSPVSLGPFLGLGVDWVSLSTTGVSAPGSGATQWTAGRARVFAQLPLSRALGLDASGGVVVPFQRPVYQVDGVGVVHRPGSVGVEASIGASWHWGSQF